MATYSFYILFIMYVLSALGLVFLNISYIKSRVNKIPECLSAHFKTQNYSEVVDYTNEKLKFEILNIFCSAIFFLLAINFIIPALLNANTSNLNNLLAALIFYLIFNFISELWNLPLSLYFTFGIEQRFGFNKQTIRDFFKDWVKSEIVSIILFSIIFCGFYYLVTLLPSYWWLACWIFLMIMQFGIMYFYPIWIAPIFNKFEPLPEGELKQAIDDLATKVGFENSGIFVMDGSRRSSHSNAYFTGFGKNRRIVLFDTLITSLSQQELVAVLAHEIGHQKLKHIRSMLYFSFIMSFIIFAFAGILYESHLFFRLFGFRQASLVALLIAISLYLPIISFFIKPLINLNSRKFEFQADNFAAKVYNSNSLVDALIKLSLSNKSNLYPHPWYSFFHYSHPTLIERINALEGKHGKIT